MKMKVIFGSSMAVALMGLGILAGSTLQAGSASAQVPAAGSVASTNSYVASYAAPVAQAALATATPSAAKSAPAAPSAPAITTAITQQQAEQAALAANPGSTVDHTRLGTDANGTPVYDVDFTNGGGAQVNGQTGVIITSEAAGTDKGGNGGPGGPGGADQAALAAKATVTQQQAEQAALTASPDNTVDHSRLGDNNGTIFWDVDFTNGGGVQVNALTGAVIVTEAAGTDSGPMRGGPGTMKP